MVQQNGTIAAIATPPGVGGIAVVRISGSGAYSVAEAVFRPRNPNKSLRAASGYTALFGYFVEDGALCDEVVARLTAIRARMWWSFPATAAVP